MLKKLSTGIEASATGESVNSGDPAVHPAARHRFQGTVFFSFLFVVRFCLRLINFIHQQVTEVLPVGFTSISRLKSPYKPTIQTVCTGVIVGKMFGVCSGARTYACN